MSKIVFLFRLFIIWILPVYIYSNDYIIQKNDTISSISKRFNQKPELITKLNNIKDNKLLAGSRIYIPHEIINYTVKEGDNLSKIAREHSTKIELIILASELKNSNIYPGKNIRIPINNKENYIETAVQNEKKNEVKSISGSFYYIVKKGETLTSISKKFNTTIPVILSCNPGINQGVNTGEKLKIPVMKPIKENWSPEKKTISKVKINYGNLPALESGFSFPVNKELIKYISQTSRGVTIFLDQQTPVKSVNNGLVEYAGKMKGYNNVVIVKYGNEQRAIYGYLSQIEVSIGSIVSNRQVLGNVNRASFLGQIELYFEMRNGINTRDILELYPFLKSNDYLVKK